MTTSSYKIIKVSNRFDEHVADYSKDFIKNTDHKIVNINECPSDHMILDIGEKSIELYKNIISSSQV